MLHRRGLEVKVCATLEEVSTARTEATRVVILGPTFDEASAAEFVELHLGESPRPAVILLEDLMRPLPCTVFSPLQDRTVLQMPVRVRSLLEAVRRALLP